MKPKKITSCMLFAMIFSCGMSLQAANIKAVNFIHDNSIRGCDIHLSQEGNKYFADVYNQQQTIEMWVRISETLDAQGGVLISTKSAFVDDPANDNKSTAGRELHSVSVTEVTNLNGSILSYKPENGQNCLW